VTAQLINCTPDEYHAIQAFSSSVAKTLIAKSPAHARAEWRKKVTPAMERGDIIHRLVLGKGKDYEVVNAKDWRTNKAKEDRDAIRAKGKVAVLVDDLEKHHIAAERIRVQLAERNIVLDGSSEQAITWTERTEFGDVPCKALLDHVWLDVGMILDLKVTEDASPNSVERTSENLGYAIQSTAYTRALVNLDPDLTGRVAFAFAFCEAEDPWAVNLSEPDGIFRELGERRWLRAVREWARCTKEDSWPSYGSAVNPITAPSWALAREGYTTDER
jgi:hypothetical protein